jgi:hypothetical protein
MGDYGAFLVKCMLKFVASSGVPQLAVLKRKLWGLPHPKVTPIHGPHRLANERLVVAGGGPGR